MKISWPPPPSRHPRREVKLRGDESLFKLPQVETLLSRSLLLDRGLLPPRSPPSLILKSILPFAEISEGARATRENHPLSLESLPRSSDWPTDRPTICLKFLPFIQCHIASSSIIQSNTALYAPPTPASHIMILKWKED